MCLINTVEICLIGIKYHKLDPSVTGGVQYVWNLRSDGFSYNGGASSGPLNAVIDSGTTLVSLVDADKT